MNQQKVWATAMAASWILSSVMSLAVDCPKQPEQVSKDTQVQVDASVAKIMRLSGAELKVDTKRTTQDLLGKLPSADRVYLEQMMYASYCSALRDDKKISEAVKASRLKQYSAEVRQTITQKSAKPPTKTSPRAHSQTQSNTPAPISQTGQNNITQIGNNNQATIGVVQPPPRKLSDEQIERLKAAVAAHPATILILYMQRDQEAYRLAKQIGDALSAVGWVLKQPVTEAMMASEGGAPLVGMEVGYKGEAISPGQTRVPLDPSTSAGSLTIQLLHAFPGDVHANPSPSNDETVYLSVFANPQSAVQ